MLEPILRFFVKNSRLNYFLFVLVFLSGVVAYMKTPKEIFPTFDLDMVVVNGHYAGASIDMLDKMAVRQIESDIKNIDGIEKMATVINSGRFHIILELSKRVDKYNMANRVKDAIALSAQNIPSDMDEPSVSIIVIKRDLMRVSLSSESVDKSALIAAAKTLKEEIVTVKNISEVTVYGDSDLYYDIRLDSERIHALGLDDAAISAALGGLAYIYPIGKVEDSRAGHYYLSTANGAKSAREMLGSRLRIAGKTLDLASVATVVKRRKDRATLFSVDTVDAVDLSIKQSSVGNALVLSKQVKDIIADAVANHPEITYTIHGDQSVAIKDRLNIVVSNILLGLILIGLLVALLINRRMSLVITLGIPTSFVMGASYLYLSGYTINMISLIGVLIALGIIVDDAIVVSENIQQHIETGMEPKEAAVLGAKEMFLPVSIASLTTLFAFLPSLMMSGTMGEVIKLIPIAVSVLLLASLVESFIFLPIHAAHLLKKEQKTTSWRPVNRLYSWLIHLAVRYRKSFLTLFMILVPLLTVLGLKQTHFQMFPRFDATTINIVLKANVNTTVEQTARYLKQIEKDIHAQREGFFIDHVGSVAGWRTDSAGNSETYPYVGLITVELQKLKPQNFVDRFITPYLSFYYDAEGRTRDERSMKVAKKLREFLTKHRYKERFGLMDIGIAERKVGPIKSDIKIGIISNDDGKIMQYVTEVRKRLEKISGVLTPTDSLSHGVDELKLKLNAYGESLGLDERKLGLLLSGLYLERKVALAFDSEHLLELRVRRKQKDSLDALKNTEITLAGGTHVQLKDVVTFHTIRSFEKVIKDNGVKNFYVYANVDSKVITASEVLQTLRPILKRAQDDGVQVSLKGEEEKNKTLRSDMIFASTIAILLITLSLLYLFNSFRETLMMISVIPFSFLGVLVGHLVLGLNLSFPSIIGLLGLSGVVVNDGIIMVMNLKKATNLEEIFHYASKRFRPIILTSITTVIGLSTLAFFPTGQAAIFQPMAVALAFGLGWGTILNLLYLPVLYILIHRKQLGA
jgi:multidrug efflux pump subunit AcrB